MNATELTPELTTLVGVARRLPPELVRQVAEFAVFLGTRHAVQPVDEPGDWSEEDMREATIASMREFEARHPDENWGEDYRAAGGAP